METILGMKAKVQYTRQSHVKQVIGNETLHGYGSAADEGKFQATFIRGYKISARDRKSSHHGKQLKAHLHCSIDFYHASATH